ncbi:uncharacterized protein LOC116225537 [Phasianus colchicus]|uniref:uncharacterized protein LOC116225537 n=1 Tax=Phasianus colchicus TaxID=9054 RepID=UPI00129EC10F|nr:uncharacterized protein LOC116225537 [Phasianus colchicus]
MGGDNTPGSRYRSISRSYFRKAHGVLLLYDISSQSSFLNVRQWIEDIEGAGTAVPLMLVGNKSDLRAGLPETAGVQAAHGQRLATVSSCCWGRPPEALPRPPIPAALPPGPQLPVLRDQRQGRHERGGSRAAPRPVSGDEGRGDRAGRGRSAGLTPRLGPQSSEEDGGLGQRRPPGSQHPRPAGRRGLLQGLTRERLRARRLPLFPPRPLSIPPPRFQALTTAASTAAAALRCLRSAGLPQRPLPGLADRASRRPHGTDRPRPGAQPGTPRPPPLPAAGRTEEAGPAGLHELL